MADKLTKADIPSFLGGDASGAKGIGWRTYQLALGFVVALVALVIALWATAKVLAFGNRQTGASLQLPQFMAPAAGAAAGGGAWDGW